MHSLTVALRSRGQRGTIVEECVPEVISGSPSASFRQSIVLCGALRHLSRAAPRLSLWMEDSARPHQVNDAYPDIK